jgi:prolipoprotein diacylglyceryltransferase
MPVHLTFDLAAVLAATLLTAAIWRWRLSSAARQPFNAGPGYFTALGAGLILGSYLLGTVNLWLSDVPALGRSILGALCGAIVAVEVYKLRRGIRGSTGLLFVPTFCVLIMVGRIGCALSGLEDNTFGTATALPWAREIGDGIARHPVALYESLSMAAFLIFALVGFARRSRLFMANGFYLMVVFYAAQRFIWEFLKPYAALLGPLNLFHLACLGLLIYAFSMMTFHKEVPS